MENISDIDGDEDKLRLFEDVSSSGIHVQTQLNENDSFIASRSMSVMDTTSSHQNAMTVTPTTTISRNSPILRRTTLSTSFSADALDKLLLLQNTSPIQQQQQSDRVHGANLHPNLLNTEKLRVESESNSFQSVLKHALNLTNTPKHTVVHDQIGTSLLSEHKRSLVLNFIRVPFKLERLLFLALFVCIDEFLTTFTILPFRILMSLINRCIKRIPRNLFQMPHPPPHSRNHLASWNVLVFMCNTMIRNNIEKGLLIQNDSTSSNQSRHYDEIELIDWIHLVLVVCASCVLSLFDISRVYHSIRGQGVMKLYVVFNVLEIFERLCCSFGVDALESLGLSCIELIRVWDLGSTETNFRRHPRFVRFQYTVRVISEIVIGIVYVSVHSLCVLAQVVTLHVAIHSQNQSLLTLLISNNFVELKSTALKPFRVSNLFQLALGDAVERFQLTLYLCLTWIHTGAALQFGFLWLCVFTSELFVDWTKHAFMAKSNRVPLKAYHRFYLILCDDIFQTRKHNAARSIGGSGVAKRLGLVTIPLAAITVRFLIPTLRHFSWIAIALMLFTALTIKLSISLALLGHASYTLEKYTEDRNSVNSIHDDADPIALRQLAHVDRYTLAKRE
eukprot:CAMPEP_0182450098 /NCGR_PEP_ID=MMETSP1172-20130603/38965_1 /TAXON_ID=708627 /ORGANISM="Timspurckia oligopyrenoides, Strain CCMP3278" /LENGTH=617 /DNA_ID=CAMNT_0024647601 /DNA_START=45 /DNA_END=1898 /DNA_ORIENTATION=-